MPTDQGADRKAIGPEAGTSGNEIGSADVSPGSTAGAPTSSTGDRGLFDARGFPYLKDRLREMVITGGFNVYPIDVENALGRHPAVHECAVFGIPDDKWGEAVQAAVQLREGRQASEAGLIAFVRQALGPVQAPKAIPFHASLRRTPVGKVAKTEVRRMALERIRS